MELLGSLTCPLITCRSDAKEGLSDEQVLNLNLELDKEHNSSHIVTGLRWSNTYGN